MLVAVDDAQWLDPASAAVLQIAFRRLSEEPDRPPRDRAEGSRARGCPSSSSALPGRAAGADLARPAQLGALHRLLEERLGLELTRPELARVQEATAGNPFFALELGRELVRTDTRPVARPSPADARDLAGAARRPPRPAARPDPRCPAPRPQRSPGRRSISSRPRMETASASSRHSRPAPTKEWSSSTTRTIRFAHPLLASICYEQAPVWKRRAVHRALAEVVTDSEERARHLALAADGPDARNRLRAGDGRRARGRTWGAPRRGRALRARCRAHPGRSRAGTAAARASGDVPSPRGQRRDRSRNSRAAPHRGPVRRRAVGRAP